MESEVVELYQSKVWKPQSYMRSTATQISTAFSTNVKNNLYQWKHEGLNHEFKARSLTKRFDTESSKLISLRGSIDAIVQCNKVLTISLVYITESQPQLCVDLSLLLHDGCWAKVRELYMGDNHDPSLVTLREKFELGKRCVQILWMRHLINCYARHRSSSVFERDIDLRRSRIRRRVGLYSSSWTPLLRDVCHSGFILELTRVPSFVIINNI
ncbi:hypothetical protein Bca52824_086689 [Brassica carinata]|uniref:Uncharacterized protein n=1 Tax=Brassica carinata TaxID=52824 RepID=A0A8X7P897_BRACI|nr:hypothetical protein Bca52824_086689 [Brassica carinata]